MTDGIARLVATAVGWDGEQGLQRANRALARLGGVAALICAPVSELVAVGMTQRQAERLRAALALPLEAPALPATVRSPADIAQLVADLTQAADERLVVLSLNTRNAVTDKTEVTRGNARFTIVDPAQVYRIALVHRAASIVLVHNHPSGDPTPSEQDREVTRRVEAAGRVIGVPLLDHVVVASSGYVSLAELGVVTNIPRVKPAWAATTG